MTAKYRVEETTAVIVAGDNVSDWETIPAFQVQRVETSMAWAVAKYRSEETAAKVADFLSDLAGEETP